MPAIKNDISRLVFMMMWFLLCPPPVFAAKGIRVRLKSPDGHVHLLIGTGNGILKYSVKFNNSTVIGPSSMGIVIDGKKFGTGAKFGKTQPYTINESYATMGAHSVAMNHCNGMRVNINSGKSTLPLILDARVFNDGVAFRYQVTSEGVAVVDKEIT